MPFTIDFLGDGAPLAWSLIGTSDDPDWTVTPHSDYRPAVYAVTAAGMESRAPDSEQCVEELQNLRADLERHPAVTELAIEQRRPGFRFAEQPVLRIEIDRVDAIRELARFVERRGPPGRVPYRAFDVDLSPEFRFCLDRDVSPTPARPPTLLHLDLPSRAAAEEDLTALEITSTSVSPSATVSTSLPQTESAGDTTLGVLETLRDRLVEADPDVLMIERGAIVPLVAEAALEYDVDLGLQRIPPGCSREEVPSYQRLAGASTFESYGQVRHSPARYNVPGRVVIDRSNTFFLGETNLSGCLDLVERSRKPLQELSWASIGNVLTAIQIREARRRGVLTQWRAWRPERFKTAAELHAADRGGTTLSPVVGLHEDVHELDFASLYPNIICEFNLSPETVRCLCHDRADVPELGYSVCDEDGYLPEVLRPLIEDRADIKSRLAEADATDGASLSPSERETLEGRSSALKWILVSCFGYQGFSNAKFGRIEVHEAINAYARDILLTAKEHLEAGGWQVLHGIVDSIWVTPARADPESPRRIAAQVSEETGIRLEYEDEYDWVAFVPMRSSEAGALTKYFGRLASRDEYKYRGIECRQHSTPPFIAEAQQELVRVLDRTRPPVAVCDRLWTLLTDLRRGAVDPSRLVIENRVSKDLDQYQQATRNAAALERAATQGLEKHPGQEVAYVVVDDSKGSLDRVRLAHEGPEQYDEDFYESLLFAAAESIVSPLGWREADIRRHLNDSRDVTIDAFSGSGPGE